MGHGFIGIFTAGKYFAVCIFTENIQPEQYKCSGPRLLTGPVQDPGFGRAPRRTPMSALLPQTPPAAPPVSFDYSWLMSRKTLHVHAHEIAVTLAHGLRNAAYRKLAEPGAAHDARSLRVRDVSKIQSKRFTPINHCSWVVLFSLRVRHFYSGACSQKLPSRK